ncbi:MAG: N-acetylgalactosamine 6-sulfate sulfatase [Rhodopirellula sp.]|nr:N-acetylgalactosamine 6-sulfate sulfatase [Rhodopirellula sp.]
MKTKLLSIIFAATCLATSSSNATDTPNILAIMVDDLGYGDLSSYGAKDLSTPAVDGLVKEGLKFNNFYANCPVCSPSRASFISGRYPELVGVPGVIRTYPQDSWGYLQKDVVTIGHKMKQAGYQTALIGKWHLGLTEEHWPNNRGFDHFHGWLGDMMDDYYKHERHGIGYMRLNEKKILPTGHATDLFTEWTCDYLNDAKSAEEPFFLFLAYNAPHTPIQPPQEWFQKVKQQHPGMSEKRAKLVALIEHMDHGIGQVLECLKATGLESNTVVIFTSDNGGQINVGANNGLLRDGKQSMYEGGLRVPTTIRWPNRIVPGSITEQRALTMDLYPTICEIAGISIEHEIDGISLLPVLDGGTLNNPNRNLFFHRREGNLRYQGLITNALIQGDWKLLHNSPFEPLELYNIKTDPQERSELSDVNRGKFNELSRLLRIQIQRGGAVPWQSPVRKDVTPR